MSKHWYYFRENGTKDNQSNAYCEQLSIFGENLLTHIIYKFLRSFISFILSDILYGTHFCIQIACMNFLYKIGHHSHELFLCVVENSKFLLLRGLVCVFVFFFSHP